MFCYSAGYALCKTLFSSRDFWILFVWNQLRCSNRLAVNLFFFFWWFFRYYVVARAWPALLQTTQGISVGSKRGHVNNVSLDIRFKYHNRWAADRTLDQSLQPLCTPGLFWSICDWGGGGISDPPFVSLEPIMLGSWNLHTRIISIQRSRIPTFDLSRPMMTSQWRHIPSFQCFLLFFHLDT